jgi:hypothetical protein
VQQREARTHRSDDDCGTDDQDPDCSGPDANSVGGMTSPDGASHWGPRERPPFEVTNYKQDLKQALQQREARLRQSSANDRDEYAPGQFTDEEDEDTTPWGRKSDQRTWYTQRWGDVVVVVQFGCV